MNLIEFYMALPFMIIQGCGKGLFLSVSVSDYDSFEGCSYGQNSKLVVKKITINHPYQRGWLFFSSLAGTRRKG